MDYGKERNGRLTFNEHWGILVIVLVLFALAQIFFVLFNFIHKLSKKPEPKDISGSVSSDTGSVCWDVLSERATNRIQFVLLLPGTTAIEPDYEFRRAHSNVWNLWIKSNHHRWKIVSDGNGKTDVKTLQVRDLRANSVINLRLDAGRFWQVNDEGHATPLKNIDSSTMNMILRTVRHSQTNSAINPSPGWGL
jgi:hypothetical protein